MEEFTGENKGGFTFNDEMLNIEIKERVKQSPHESKKNEDRFWAPKYDYAPTGLLEFRIGNIYGDGIKTVWKDTKTSNFEQQLVSIVQSFS